MSRPADNDAIPSGLVPNPLQEPDEFARIAEQAGAQDDLKARILNGVGWLGVLVSAAYVSAHLARPFLNNAEVILAVVAGSLSLALAVWIRSGASIDFAAAAFLVGIKLILATNIWYTGGIHSPAIYWNFALFGLAPFISGMRVFIVMCGLFALEIGAFAILEANGFRGPEWGLQSPAIDTVVRTSASIMVVGFLAWMYRRQRALVVEALQASREALAGQARELERAQQLSRTGSWSWNVSSDHVEISPEMHRIFGLASQDSYVDQEQMFDLVHPDDRANLSDLLLRAIRQGQDFSEKSRLLLPNGSIRWIRTVVSCLTDATGRTVRLTGACQDVTELETATRALAEREANIRTLVDGSQQGVVVAAAGQPLFVSKSLASMLGITDGSAALTSAELRRLLVKVGAKTGAGFLTDPVSTVEIEIDRADGVPLWLEIADRQIEWYGQPATLITVIDMTEKRGAQKRLKLFRQLMDESRDAVHVIDAASGVILDVNDAAVDELGYSRAQLIGTVSYDLDPDLPPAFSWSRFAARLKRDGHLFIENRHKRADGTIFPVESHITWVEVENNPYIVAVIRDTTERQAATREIRELADMVRSSPEFIGIASMDRGAEYINPAGLRMMGLPPDTDVRTMTHSVHPNEEADRLFEQWLPRAMDYGFWAGETVICHTDGSLVPVDMLMSIRQDDEGQVIGFNCYMRNIEERIESQRALRESEERFHKLVDNAPDAIYVVSLDGEIRDVNDQVCRMLGYSRDELIGQHVESIAAGVDHNIWSDFMIRLSDGEELTLHGEHVCKDGSRIPVEVRPCLIEFGGQTLNLAIARDISDRIQAQEELRRSEERYRLIADNVSDEIWIRGLDLGAIYISPSVSRLRGFSVEQALALGPEETFPELALSTLRKLVADELAAEDDPESDPSRYREVELEMTMADGSRRWIESRLTFLRNDDGSPRAILGVSRDVHDRRLAEEEIRQSRDLLEKRVEERTAELRHLSAQLESVQERERARLSYELHDELGQILTGLRMELGVLRETIGTPTPEAAVGLRTLDQLVERTVQTTRRIVSELRPRILDELGLQAAIESLLRETGDRVGIRVAFRNELDDLRVDPARATAVYRIIQEAVTNVVKHADADEIRVGIGTRGGNTWVVVEDNGIGISPERPAGNGLGMTSMRERARLSGGYLDVRPRDAGGTIVEALLPLGPDEQGIVH